MRIRSLSLVSLLAVVVGCGGGDSGSSLSFPPNMPPIVAKSIEFHGGSLYEGSAMSRGGYQSLQDFFHRRLPSNAGLFNEYHALLVELGKEFCRPKPICLPCPLRTMCPYSGEKGECPTPPRAPLASNATAIEEKERD